MKQLNILKWFARIVSLVILLLGLPFYFGYGNPLPFADPDYSLWKNIVLVMYPLIFIGLALGWKYEKIGGYLVIVPTITGFLVKMLTQANFSTNMLFALIPGVLYLAVEYQNPRLKINNQHEERQIQPLKRNPPSCGNLPPGWPEPGNPEKRN